MKLLGIFIIVIFLLLLSPNHILAQPDPLENPKVPYMTDGLGNGVNPGTNKKSSNEIFEDFLNIFFKPPKKDNGSNTSPSNTNLNAVTPIPSPSIYITQPVDNSTIPTIPSSGDESAYASTFTSLIHQDCTSDGVGIVNKKNTVLSQSLLGKSTCLTRPKGVMNGAGIAEIEASVTAFYNLQCVGCVRAMAKARNRPYAGTGNAKQHIGQRVSQYQYFENDVKNYKDLVPGSIGISNEGTYGHIFYITEVYRDTNGLITHYLAFECNYGANGYVRQDLKRSVKQVIKGTNTLYLAGWQKPL